MHRRFITSLSVLVVLAVAAIAVGGAAADDHDGKRHEKHHSKLHENKASTASITSTGTTLEVRKVLVPASDTGRFNLIVRKTRSDLIKQTTNVGNGGSTGRFGAPSGQLLTVEEKAAGSTKLSDYTTTLECHTGTGPTGPTVASSSRTGATLTLSPHTDYTCSFTNTRKTSTTTTGSTTTSTTTTTGSSLGSTIEVRKVLVPASDTGRFNLIVRKTRSDLIKQTTNVGNGGSTGRFAAPSGQLLTVEEKAAGSTKLSDYTTTLECHTGTGPTGPTVASSSRTGATLTLSPHTDYTCSFTNTRKTSTTTTGSTTTSTTTTTGSSLGSTIEVRKVLVPAADAGRFNLIVRILRGTLIHKTTMVGNGGTTGRFSVPSGPVLNVEENAAVGTSLANYTSKVDCKVSSGPHAGTAFPTKTGHAIQFVAQPGDNYTCTFTNTRTSH